MIRAPHEVKSDLTTNNSIDLMSFAKFLVAYFSQSMAYTQLAMDPLSTEALDQGSFSSLRYATTASIHDVLTGVPTHLKFPCVVRP